MKITFFIKFHTRFGQKLFITGDNKYLGDNKMENAVALSWLNEEFWKVEMLLPASFSGLIRYRYFLKDIDGLDIYDAEQDRFINIPSKKKKDISVIDTWNSGSNEKNAYFTSAFDKLLHKATDKNKIPSLEKYNFEFRVKAPLLNADETICLCGSSENLGSWDSEYPIILSRENNWFIGRVFLEENEWPANYKYGIYSLTKEKMICFEDGANRILLRNENHSGLTLHVDGFIKINNVLWKGAGVNIPVFSLRTQDSFGVGEFMDLKLMIDWAKETGLQLIQLLPVNDTTVHHDKRDSYPYASISAFALHPLYINLEKVAGKAHSAILSPLNNKQKKLNSLPVYDYDEVIKIKIRTLHKLYELLKDDFEENQDYFRFFDINRDWLVPYAVFSFLREKNKTFDYTTWKNYSTYNETEIQQLASPERKEYPEIAFYYFVQYHLHLQLKEVSEYAAKKNVVLKGDIPIGVYRYGCDAWQNPSLFNMNEQAGAPPDDFAVKGQNWGFPTYNWSNMQKDDYGWWRRRFDQMSLYYDAFRIDHILGFFRIWSVPYSAVEAILGRFVPAIPINISELNDANIWFDRDRYCNPFITDELLWNLFHDKATEVKNEYLESLHPGIYQLKPGYNTQRKVEEEFNLKEDSAIKQGLFDLIANVILIEDADAPGQQFHFRIAMENTYSFSKLDVNTQNYLKNLYNNYFYHRQDEFWRIKGMEKLSPLKRSTEMLIFGEDLGMVPECVPDVMRQLGILSLEVERMPKAINKDFSHPAIAPYLSDVMPSTHDMSTIRGWWEEDRKKTQEFYNTILGHYGQAPYYCEPWINKEIIIQHMYSPAMWAIFLWQDLMGIDGKLRRENPNDERINVPADPYHYWGYRMHIGLEDLLKEKEFNSNLKNMIEDSGRNKL